MRCDDVRRMLEDEGGLVSPAARKHAATCETCLTESRRWDAVRAGFRAMGDEEAPPFLHSRIMAHVEEAVRQRPRRRFLGLRQAWAGPLLVLAFIAVLGIYGLLRSPRLAEVVPAPPVVVGSASRSEKVDARPDVTAEVVGDGALPVAAPAEASSSSAVGAERAAAARPAAPQLEPAAQVPDAGGYSKNAARPARVGVASSESAGPTRTSARGSLAAEASLPLAPSRTSSGQVACLLYAEGSTFGRALDLPAAAAPPPGVTWHLEVSPLGESFLVDGSGRRTVMRRELAEALARLDPIPGPYRLARSD